MCSDALLDLLVAEKKRYRRAFFRHYGVGPWSCFECGEEVVFDDLNVHHVDEDHHNDSKDNLVAMHGSCHATLHGRQRGMSPDIARARWNRPGAAERHAAVMAALPRSICEACGATVASCHMPRHRGSRECVRRRRKTIAGEENYALLQEQAAVV